MITHRREDVTGEPMLVNLPVVGGDLGWRDSGEGGLAFFFVVLERDHTEEDRQVCMGGGPSWPLQDVVVGPPVMVGINEELSNERDWDHPGIGIDAALLIGSTGLSLYHDGVGYFSPTYMDLTAQGKALYDMLTNLYGEGSVQITTLLDT